MAERRLRVAIDGRELGGHVTGVGRYLGEVLRAWPVPPGRDDILIITPSRPEGDAGLPEGLVTWRVEPGRAGTRWEQTRLAAAARAAQPSVFFAPAYTAPLRLACPSVVTIHDVSFAAHPEWFARREGFRRRWLTRQSALRAHRVLTVSEFSKAEIVRWLEIDPMRIVVAPNGAPAAIPGVPPGSDRPPTVLYVGSLFNRRRLPELIAGFALAVQRVPEARLVLIGANRTHPRLDPLMLARTAGVADRVEWHPWLDDARLELAYQSARVFAFLSDYEGFGLTPFEAIAHGAPSIALDTPLSREVYGTGAALVRPDPPAIAEALVRLLTEETAHDALLEAGRRQAARFSWTATARLIRDTLVLAAAS